MARELGLDYAVSVLKDNYRSEFMPTTEPFYLKLVYERKTLRILGAQVRSKEDLTQSIKGLPQRGTTDPVYKYPLGNPNVMEAHIFQLKDGVPANMGRGTMDITGFLKLDVPAAFADEGIGVFIVLAAVCRLN